MNTFIITFLDEDTFAPAEGVLIDQAYEPVSGRWMLLVSGKDGKIHSVPHSGVGTASTWIGSGVAVMYGEDDDDDDDTRLA